MVDVKLYFVIIHVHLSPGNHYLYHDKPCVYMKNTVLLSIICISFFSRCNTGEYALKKGRPEQAVQLSAQRLNRHPSDAKAAKVLNAAYKAYEKIHQDNIEVQIAGNQPFKWESVLYEYYQLQKTYQLLAKCQACLKHLQSTPQSYSTTIERVIDLAAAERYEAGIPALKQKGNREACKDAFGHFIKVKQLRPKYKDTDHLLALAREYATLRVVIEPLRDVYSLSQNRYDYLEKELAEELFKARSPSELIRFYPPAVARNDSIPPHHLIRISLASYRSQSETNTSSCETAESTQAYKVGTKKINDTTVVDVVEKVKGTLTTYRKELSAGCRIEFEVIDLDNDRLIHRDRIYESTDWKDEWHSFTGDERALNGKILHSSQNLFPPSDLDFFKDMSRSLAVRLRNRLRDFYKSQ